MRKPIDTASRNGHFIILEDCVRQIYDVARWSEERADWVSATGQPAALVPTHWRPLALGSLGQILAQVASPAKGAATDHDAVSPAAVEAEPAQGPYPATPGRKRRRRHLDASVIGIGLILIAAAAAAPPEAGLRNAASGLARYVRWPDQPFASIWQQIEDRAVQLANDSWRPQQHPAADAGDAVPGSLLARAQRDAALAREQMADSEARHRRDLDEEHARAAEIAADLGKARAEIERQGRQLSDMRDLAARAETAAQERVTALQASLRAERDNAAALGSELAQARRDLASEAARSGKAMEDAELFKSVSERATAKLQEERDRNAALTAEMTTLRQDLSPPAALTAAPRNAPRNAPRDAPSEELARPSWSAMMRVDTSSRPQSREDGSTGPILPATQEAALERWSARATIIAPVPVHPAVTPARAAAIPVAKPAPAPAQTAPGAPLRITPAVAGQGPKSVPSADPKSATAQNGPETDRLIARARSLLTQGNIGAARAVLERAAETGSARALFALAQTYDPAVLASWSTYGTQGDVAKARALYARASAGGSREAQARVEALGQ